MKASAISSSGHSIEAWIEGPPIFITLAGWCSVFHHSTENLMIGTLTKPTRARIDAVYRGILPDLFREGQGVIAEGRLNDAGVFVASEVLARHDEKYMPPEVAKSLKDNPPPPNVSTGT